MNGDATSPSRTESSSSVKLLSFGTIQIRRGIIREIWKAIEKRINDGPREARAKEKRVKGTGAEIRTHHDRKTDCGDRVCDSEGCCES